MKKPLKEFLVFLLALLVGTSGYFICLFYWQKEISFFEILPVAIYALVSISAHFLTSKFLPNRDPLILPIVVAINGIGLTQINRIDFAYKANGFRGNNALNQFIWTIIGLVLVVLISKFVQDHRILRKFQWTAMFFGLVLIVLPMLPILGSEVNGARVWVSLGFLGTFQPAEFTKILLIIFFASFLTVNADKLRRAGSNILGLQIPRFRDSAPVLIVWGICLLVLIFQHDLGTSLLFFSTFIMMVYVATDKASWGLIGIGLFFAGAYFAYKTFWHVQQRVEVWANPFSPALYNKTYGGSGQIVQGLFALGNGSLFGTGLGKGFPTFTPFSNSDFIFSALGEELGLTGTFAIIILYLLLIERGLKISLKVKDSFGKLLAAGFSFSLTTQLFVVIGGVTKLIPMTGLTLPFIAKGGSSLLANYILVGILLLISNNTFSKADSESFKVSEAEIKELMQKVELKDE